jgi:hypothetical protein
MSSQFVKSGWFSYSTAVPNLPGVAAGIRVYR